MKLSPYRKSMMHVGLGVVGGLSGKWKSITFLPLQMGVVPSFTTRQLTYDSTKKSTENAKCHPKVENLMHHCASAEIF